MTDTTPAAAAEVAAATVKLEEGVKVFAGNLAFATTEEELKKLFSEAGSVTSVQIIKRGSRHLGYGFVTFATDSEAQKSIELLNDKEVEGRKIAVQLAKPETEGGGKKGAAGGAPKTNGENGGAGAAEAGTDAKPARGGRGGAAAGRGRGGRGGAAASRRPRVDEGEEEGAEGLGTPAAGAPKKSATPRKPAGPKGAPEGPPSQTLLFVANLPFEITRDEQLKEIFTAEGFAVEKATVARVPYRKRSRGYGFVDFANHEDQQKALEKLQGKEIQGRTLTLKVANEDEGRKRKEAEAAVALDGTPAAGKPEVKEEPTEAADKPAA